VVRLGILGEQHLVVSEADLAFLLGRDIPSAGIELNPFMDGGGRKRLNLVGREIALEITRGELLRAHDDASLGSAATANTAAYAAIAN